MSVVGNNRVGIPIVLLHDAEGCVVTVETKSGVLIRGLLFEAEDQMNIYIKKVVFCVCVCVCRVIKDLRYQLLNEWFLIFCSTTLV